MVKQPVFRHKLDTRKAIQAAAILARGSRDAGRIGSKRLLALLYIANRECLKRSGRPLVGGVILAMQHGPIHGEVYDLIRRKEGVKGLEDWSKHFHNDDYIVVLDDDPGVGDLSRFEIGIINEVLESYQDEDDFDLARLTHRFHEYAYTYKRKVPGKRHRIRAIPLVRLIDAVRLGPMKSTILRDLKEKEEINAMFANAEKEARQKSRSRKA